MQMWYDDPKVLQKVRKSKGLTQAQLAERAGVTRTLIADIELGRRSFEGVGEQIWAALAEADFLLRSGKSIGELMTEALSAKTPEEREAALAPMTKKGRKRFLQVEREATVDALESHLKQKARKIEILENHIKHLTDPRPLAERRADLEARMNAANERAKERSAEHPGPFNALLSSGTWTREDFVASEEWGRLFEESRQLLHEEDREKYVAAIEDQNKLLREYLDSRQIASLANATAEELSDKVHRLPDIVQRPNNEA
jgi:transcriptional regulator with XRE-family HTH domain